MAHRHDLDAAPHARVLSDEGDGEVHDGVTDVDRIQFCGDVMRRPVLENPNGTPTAPNPGVRDFRGRATVKSSHYLPRITKSLSVFFQCFEVSKTLDLTEVPRVESVDLFSKTISQDYNLLLLRLST